VILVDTSAWVDFFRGHGRCCALVDAAVEHDEAALCGPIVTELRRGVRATERARVLELLAACHLLPQPSDLWVEAGELGHLLRRRGATVKSMDLLIAAHALAHGVPLLSANADFALMQRAGLPLHLIEA
jgi:hypothetical protein